MAIELKQSLKLSQQLVMTPQLQQAIKLLQLNRLELADMVTQELVENPILEEVSGTPDESAPTPEEFDPTSANLSPEEQQRRDEDAQGDRKKDDQMDSLKDDFNWEAYIQEYNTTSSTAPSMREVNDELPSFDSVLTKTTSLEDHVLWQLSMAQLTEEEEHFGELVIGNLKDDGYLSSDAHTDELAKEANLDVEDAEEILKIIRNFDPIGVSSRNLQECLLTQAHLLKPRQEVVEKIISDFLPHLEKKNYSAVSKELNIPMNDVIEATKVILEFEPKPGRSFQSGNTHYITPDIYVYKVGDEFVITLNEDGMPKLRISPYYRDIIAGTRKEGKETKEYVKDKLRSAMWLIRSIHNRQKTIYRVTETIVQRQRDFFEKGIEHLKPMVLKDVANDIGMHESTISRVTTNKYVHTPVGIFELKYFFNSSIAADNLGGSVASEAVKEKIRQMVSKEDTKHPLSDQKIVDILKKDGISIARRTVAKYRDVLGILPSAKRKKIF